MGKTVSIERAFERIRLRMLSFGITMDDSGSTVLTLTSRACGEGVTTIALGLATELAREGNTLLIDASSEGVRIAESLNVGTVPLKIEGISRVELQKNRYITHLRNLKIDLLSLSVPKKGESNSLDFDAPFLKDIRSHYKSIIVDAGSFQKRSSRIWPKWTDHTLLVIDTTSTTQEILERFSTDLNRFDIKLSGFIMNKRSFHIPKFLWSKIS